jgi:hypothetical protein
MKTLLLIVLILGFLWLFPIFLHADCISLGGYTSWVLENNQKIIFYRGSRPIASVKLQDCKVYSDSIVQLKKSYTCDYDKIIIDGQECTLFSVDSLAF